jgi:hypothetical protein
MRRQRSPRCTPPVQPARARPSGFAAAVRHRLAARGPPSVARGAVAAAPWHLLRVPTGADAADMRQVAALLPRGQLSVVGQDGCSGRPSETLSRLAMGVGSGRARRAKCEPWEFFLLLDEERRLISIPLAAGCASGGLRPRAIEASACPVCEPRGGHGGWGLRDFFSRAVAEAELARAARVHSTIDPPIDQSSHARPRRILFGEAISHAGRKVRQHEC